MAPFTLIHRNRTANNPPSPAKEPGAIKIGIFGASWIAPQALIVPAKSHPGVVVHAIAARDLKRAEAYAKKHGIPNALGSYQALLDDPAIDAVYIPLPNGLHYEWTLRALRANKHVLVEKPFVSNSTEATALIAAHASLPHHPSAPVLLEAVHYRFHPAWQTFLSLLSGPDIASATTTLSAPALFFSKHDIRFSYALAGGAMMDMGSYGVTTLRDVFGPRTAADECIAASPRLVPKGGDRRCDQAMKATWRWPGGALGSADVDLAKSSWGLPVVEAGGVVVRHREVEVVGEGGEQVKEPGAKGHRHVKARTVAIWNFVMPAVWHRIDVVEEHAVKDASGKVVKRWTTKENRKAYTWGDLQEEGKVRVGEDYWSSYRYMLEEFVNKIKGRQGSGVWVEGEESVKGMVMIDQTYEKCGLPVRPTSEFK